MSRLELYDRQVHFVGMYEGRIRALKEQGASESDLAPYRAVVAVTRREAEWPIPT
jgi:hypothetical protein